MRAELALKSCLRGDPIRWNGRMVERWNRMVELRNTRNILKHGRHGIF